MSVDAIRWDAPEAYGDVQRLAYGVLSPDVGESWDAFSLQAVALLTPMLLHCHSQGQGSLPGVYQWLTNPNTDQKAQADELLQSAIPHVKAGGRKLKELLKSERTASIVWNILTSRLDLYSDELVAGHTDHSDLDLRDLQHGIRPISLYLTPPFADVARLRPLLGTVTEMLCALFSAQQDTPRQPVCLFLDEMANLGAMRELERGQSYLQGCGVRIVQTWQNVLQVRQVYGKDSPILASVGTQVLYTPGDYETAEYLSKECGLTTERLHPETRAFTFWGLLTSTSIGTSEHERRLVTADECRRFDEHDAVVLVKGCAPILGTKLGSQAPEVIDLAKPILKRVAMVAGAFLLAGSLTTWALWPKANASAPTLAMTTVKPQPPEAQPVPSDPGTRPRLSIRPDDPMAPLGMTASWPEPEGDRTLTWMDKMNIKDRERYGLFQSRQHGHKSPMVTPEGWMSQFSTLEDCEARRVHTLQSRHQYIAIQPPGSVGIRRTPNGQESGQGANRTRETWFCVELADQPS